MVDDIIHLRDKEKGQILNYLKNSVNTVICGSSGTGKTTLIRSVVEEVNNNIGQAVYVDCSLYQTANAVLREILLSLGSVIASKSNYDLIKRLKEKTKKLKLIVFLDHSQNLKDHEILNIILGLGFCVCMVSDSFENYRKMDLTLRSRIANLMNIDQLSREQILEIIKEKVKPSISDELIQKIVEKSNGNLTFALNLVSSIDANSRKDRSQIDEINFLEVNHDDLSNEDHKIILQILQQSKRLPSGELYQLYCEKSEYPKSERSFRKYMEVLCKKGLVESMGEKRGRSYQIIESQGVLNG